MPSRGHKKMMALSDLGNVQQELSTRPCPCGDKHFGARLIYQHIPDILVSGNDTICRIFIENTGQRGWFKKENPYQAHVRLGIYLNGKKTDQIPVREDTHPGERIHFSFHLKPPKRSGLRSGRFQLRLKLLGEHTGFDDRQGLVILEKIMVSQKTRWIQSKLFKS